MKILIKNGKIVDVLKDKIYPADILIDGNIILKIGKIKSSFDKLIDAKEKFIVPGLIDAHTHNEISMLSPKAFAEAILRTGTTSIILDFHDLANVVGIKQAYEFNKNQFLGTILDVFYMIPICVPSSEKTETCGNKDSLQDIIPLFNDENVRGLGEIMDIQGVLNQEERLMFLINEAKKRNLIIDGHCPELSEKKLDSYLKYSGASSDHEFSSIKEAQEKLNKGMYLIFRRGITKEPNSFQIWQEAADKSKLLLSTDGCITSETISKKGYMNFAVKQMINEGIPPIEVIKMSTINVAKHYNLKKVGQIKEGFFADLLIISDLEKFSINRVIAKGKLISKRFKLKQKIPPDFFCSIKINKILPEDLLIKNDVNKKFVRVIELKPNSLETIESTYPINHDSKFIHSNNSDGILHISIINRYKTSMPINSFVKISNFNFGAIASSNAQDAQNIIVFGTNSKDMAFAVNHLIDIGGGCVLIENEKILYSIQLPLAGIMSLKSVYQLSKDIKLFEKRLSQKGFNFSNILFFLSMGFTVSSIPNIKLTDKGLYSINEDCFKEPLI